jgi:hypothetical protein
MARFHKGSGPPARVTFKAAEPRYSVYGWSVAIARSGLEFSVLANAGRTGFTLSGSGRANVTTAPLFAPRHVYSVVERVSGSIRRLTETATARGRLRIAVPLGPAKNGPFKARVTIR